MSALPTIQIIGHGLAGAILAETLSASGLKVSVWDDGGTASSRVAAGMFTPLTGRRLIPSWSLEEALPVVTRFYPALEKALDCRFFYPLPTYRIFRREDERAEWERDRENGFTKPLHMGALPFRAPFGGCEIRGGGWVDLPKMLDALIARRKAKNEWGRTEDPEITVWAEGVRASENPLWKDVGWRNAQGDILTLRIPELAEDRIYNFGKFLVPLGNQLFRCGATYAWDETSPQPREQGRLELEADLQSVLKLPYEVVGHEAGIRPVAVARVPVAGPHPEQSDQWIFNGFGSKGVLMAPWMAERLLTCIRDRIPLPGETQASRRMRRQRDRAKTSEKKNHP